MGGVAKIELGMKPSFHSSEINVSGLIQKSYFAWEVQQKLHLACLSLPWLSYRMGHLQNIGSCPKLRNVQTVRDILKKWCLNLTYLKLTEQNGPTWPKMAPRWHQDAPRWPQDVPKMAARRSPDGSKLLQEAARAPRRAPRGPQDGEKKRKKK